MWHDILRAKQLATKGKTLGLPAVPTLSNDTGVATVNASAIRNCLSVSALR
jgi:hypothetical protein